MSAQRRKGRKAAGVLALEAKRAEAIIARITAAGEAGLVTTNEQLAEDLGFSRVTTTMSLRALRKQERVELIGEKGNPVFLLRVPERVA